MRQIPSEDHISELHLQVQLTLLLEIVKVQIKIGLKFMPSLLDVF